MSIESILSKMSANIFPNYTKDFEEGSEDLNCNSFLSKSGNLLKYSTKETNSSEDQENNEDDENNVTETKTMEVDDSKDVDVNSIKIEENLTKNANIGQFSCHLCSFVCVQKNDFQEHLLTHYTYSCNHCDYASRTEGRLKRHIKDFHSNNSPENFSGQKVPTNNPKSLKCKHCGIISPTKEMHWSHQRTHLDVTKCLQCPNCPFITEYKHHLEYHIRNHDKVKPYQCSKCQYRCVNKSMLNSHKKSHSNVYQFRCADCSYASKYCHSLKQHLTRHEHQPAPVLNEDGSLPVYDNSNDILSMKRGPNNRCTNVQNNPLGSQDMLGVTAIPITTTAQNVTVSQTSFNKDQMYSFLNWTFSQRQSNPLNGVLPLPFPLIPTIPNLMSMPSFSRQFQMHNNSDQHIALDLSLKSQGQQKNISPQDSPQSQPHSGHVCGLNICDKDQLEAHLLSQVRPNNHRCIKCGNRYDNVLEFFAHLSQRCS